MNQITNSGQQTGNNNPIKLNIMSEDERGNGYSSIGVEEEQILPDTENTTTSDGSVINRRSVSASEVFDGPRVSMKAVAMNNSSAVDNQAEMQGFAKEGIGELDLRKEEPENNLIGNQLSNEPDGSKDSRGSALEDAEITESTLKDAEKLMAKALDNSLKNGQEIILSEETMDKPVETILGAEKKSFKKPPEEFVDYTDKNQELSKKIEEILEIVKEVSTQLSKKRELLSELRDELNVVTSDINSVLEGGTPDALKSEVSELEESVSNLHSDLEKNVVELKTLIQKDPNILIELRDNKNDILDIKEIKDLVDSMQNITPIQETTKNIEETADGKIIMERSGLGVLDDIAKAIVQLTESRGETISDDEAMSMASLAYDQYLNKAKEEFRGKISASQFFEMVSGFTQKNGGKFTLQLSSNGPVFDIVAIREIISSAKNNNEGFNIKNNVADDYSDQLAA